MLNTKGFFDRRKKRTRFALKKRNKGKVRLSVFKSNKHLYVQIIDDVASKTLVAVSTLHKDLAGKFKHPNIEAAKAVGMLIAKNAKKAKISEIVFDKGGYLFHGVVKALADSARKYGLKF